MFVGVTIDSGVIRDNWRTMDFSTYQMLTLASGLDPCYLRVGGTDADFLIFNETQGPALKEQRLVNDDFSMTVADWDTLNEFVQEVGWQLIFDFNSLLRKDGKWDPTNAIELLKYSVKKGYKPAGYELSNEPDLFVTINTSVTPASLAADVGTLRDVLSSMTSSPFLVFGPDTSSVFDMNYFDDFLAAGGGKNVDVATFHHYYLNSATATVDQFVDVKVFDSLKSPLEEAVGHCLKHAPGKQCWLGETSTTYGGGTLGVSDRFVAGFLWLDKLGLSALIGLQGVVRQSFYGGNYGLIDVNLDPNPDYFLTVLYKRLVGSPVLNVTQDTNPNVRVYAHCTNTNSSMGYPKGSVTVYLMNLGSEAVTVNMNGGTSQLYMLTAGDDSGLVSKFVKLNGNTLVLPNKGELPPFNPLHHEGPLQLQGFTMGFIVFPEAAKKECLV
ncbi:hypothetical protein SNE40_004555 [Patella caerulea]